MRPGLDTSLRSPDALPRFGELRSGICGPVLSARHARYAALREAPPSALLGEPLLHTASRPQAWQEWATRIDLDPATLRMGTRFDRLYYLLEAAAAGLGIAIAPEPLVAEDLASGRLIAPWGFVESPARLALWVSGRSRDGRAERLAQWLGRELGG